MCNLEFVYSSGDAKRVVAHLLYSKGSAGGVLALATLSFVVFKEYDF